MFCTRVDDDAEGVILEFPILCMYYILATSGRLNGFGTRSIFISNPHDLIDVV